MKSRAERVRKLFSNCTERLLEINSRTEIWAKKTQLTSESECITTLGHVDVLIALSFFTHTKCLRSMRFEFIIEYTLSMVARPRYTISIIIPSLEKSPITTH